MLNSIINSLSLTPKMVANTAESTRDRVHHVFCSMCNIVGYVCRSMSKVIHHIFSSVHQTGADVLEAPPNLVREQVTKVPNGAI